MTTKTMTATAGPKIKTALPGPIAKRIIEADAKFVNPAYPRPSFKLVAERASGVWRDLDIIVRDSKFVSRPWWRHLGVQRANQQALARALGNEPHDPVAASARLNSRLSPKSR